VSAGDCAWPGCPAAAKPNQLMCYPHWVSLPKHLREGIWRHYRRGQNALTCSPEYREALRDVLEYARGQVTQ
jgi:hypothetical protein